MWPLLHQIDEWLVANRLQVFIGLLRTGVGTGCHVTDHVTDLLWFWFRATRLQLQIKARVNSLWPLWKLFLCDRIVLNWFAVQTRVTRWLQHYQNMSWNLPEVSSLLSKNFVMIWDSATKWNSQKLNFPWMFAKKRKYPLKIWKKGKTPSVPRWSPIQVLTRLNVA